MVRCPNCRASVEWHSTPTRPFCSERCRLLDLGEWAAERRSIPGETLEDLGIDPDELDSEPRH
ncbi:MAG: DNA gyrase inhibitor YacG [Pseudomonadota bacterium]